MVIILKVNAENFSLSLISISLSSYLFFLVLFLPCTHTHTENTVTYYLVFFEMLNSIKCGEGSRNSV